MPNLLERRFNQPPLISLRDQNPKPLIDIHRRDPKKQSTSVSGKQSLPLRGKANAFSITNEIFRIKDDLRTGRKSQQESKEETLEQFGKYLGERVFVDLATYQHYIKWVDGKAQVYLDAKFTQRAVEVYNPRKRDPRNPENFIEETDRPEWYLQRQRMDSTWATRLEEFLTEDLSPNSKDAHTKAYVDISPAPFEASLEERIANQYPEDPKTFICLSTPIEEQDGTWVVKHHARAVFWEKQTIADFYQRLKGEGKDLTDITRDLIRMRAGFSLPSFLLETESVKDLLQEKMRDKQAKSDEVSLALGQMQRWIEGLHELLKENAPREVIIKAFQAAEMAFVAKVKGEMTEEEVLGLKSINYQALKGESSDQRALAIFLHYKRVKYQSVGICDGEGIGMEEETTFGVVSFKPITGGLTNANMAKAFGGTKKGVLQKPEKDKAIYKLRSEHKYACRGCGAGVSTPYIVTGDCGFCQSCAAHMAAMEDIGGI